MRTIEKSKEKRIKSDFTKDWILTNGIPIVESYNGNLTLRALHYRLVALGMTNDTNHYKKVVQSMIDARWQELVAFDAFMDHERETHGSTDWTETDVESAVDSATYWIKQYLKSYHKNRWENQPNYVEIFIEKKALQGVFDRPCASLDVALNPCKGYPSLTFQYAAKQRFDEAIEAGKNPIIIYFGDYDCSGEDIPRSIGDTLGKMNTDVEIRRIALKESQVLDWNLPPAPTKTSDSRAAKWEGIGQVELDAVEPKQIVQLLRNAVAEVFDDELYAELLEQQATEREEFRERMKEEINDILEANNG